MFATPFGVALSNTVWCNGDMELKPYLKSLSDEQREALAAECQTSVGHLRNCSYGLRPVSPELCVAIERASRCQVTRQEMREDWAAIWPELVRKTHTKAAA